MEDKDIYIKDDNVYDYINNYGWGVVTKIDTKELLYPVIVTFHDGKEVSYTKDGKLWDNKKTVLSFTEYDLVNGGFSQIRPFPDIAVDTPIFVRWSDEPLWNIRYFSHFDKKGNAACWRGQLKSTEITVTTTWCEYSLENPLL